MKSVWLKYVLAFLLFSPGLLYSKKLKAGEYRGVLLLNAEKKVELPFNFEVSYIRKTPQIIIRNADEIIVVTEISIRGDSVHFKMPVFDTEFRCKITRDGLRGNWINNYRTTNRLIPFEAKRGKAQRFLFPAQAPNPIFEGKWEVTFSPGSKESSKAIGLFKHVESTDYVTGTFLTETGDYRYLEGMKAGQNLYLSCFDGSHAFLFIAALVGDTIHGTFYSGSHWIEKWSAFRNSEFELKDPEALTKLKSTSAKLDFSYPDLSGNEISLHDARFKDKVIIVQIMGSWCPNCKDESKYLVNLYKKYHQSGLEIIALAFEKTKDKDKSLSQLQRLKTQLDIPYPILLTLRSGKAEATESISALDKISAFPTTIFLNKKMEIVKIHTGFNGPATGSAYEIFKERTENLINNLIKE